MTEKEENIIITDAELRQILDDYAEASLSALQNSAPPDLEASLDATISRLAARSRRRRIWLRTTAAAASVALLLTAGIGFLSRNHTLTDTPTLTADAPGSDTDTGSLIPEFPALASLSPAHDEGYRQETDGSAAPLTAVNVDIARNAKTVSPEPHHTAPKPTKQASANRPQASQVEKISEQLTANGIVDRIAASVSPASLSPQITLSVNVPDNLPTSPAETAAVITSREMSKVMESLDKVNAVFYEARKIASSLSEDVAYAASSPLRSI